VAGARAPDGEPVIGEDPRLESLRRSIEKTESDLCDLGYHVERCITHPGTRLSNQIFDEKTLILVLLGRVRVQSNEESAILGPGDRLDVPPGVPYILEVEEGAPAYWLHALLKEETPEPDASAPPLPS